MDIFVRAEDLEEIEFQESFPPIMTAHDAQNLFGISKNTLYNLLGSGSLKGFRIGHRDWRITREAIYEYIRSH